MRSDKEIFDILYPYPGFDYPDPAGIDVYVGVPVVRSVTIPVYEGLVIEMTDRVVSGG